MKNSILIFATIALAFLSGCNQTKLTNGDAKELIIKTLNLPVTYRHEVNKRPSMGSGFELDGLRGAGLITGSEYLDINRPINIQITKMGQPSFLGENNEAYMFKTNDIEFNQITGISINKEEQTATVRFSLIAKDATLAAYALAKTDRGFSGKKYINYSLINPLNGELVFKKFDNGWQLLEQGRSGSDLLNQILDSDANSNRNDDYTKLIYEKINEIKRITEEKKQKDIKELNEEMAQNLQSPPPPAPLANEKEVRPKNQDQTVFNIVEEMPEFPGGKETLRQYLLSNTKYPALAKENGIQGKVYVSFIINEDGSISNAKIARSISPLLDNEALRVVSTLPKFKPGKQSGKNVKVNYIVPVSFSL